jgi:hypothetical protein
MSGSSDRNTKKDRPFYARANFLSTWFLRVTNLLPSGVLMQSGPSRRLPAAPVRDDRNLQIAGNADNFLCVISAN